MDRIRRAGLIGLALCWLAPAGLAGPAAIGGAYLAEGRNPDGSAYSGRVTINQADGQVGMTWKIANDSYIGSGRLDGRVLTVDWGDKHPVVYVVMPDGELHGTWADGTGLEKLTPEQAQ